VVEIGDGFLTTGHDMQPGATVAASGELKGLGVGRMGPLLPRNSTRRERTTDLPSLMANAHYRAVQRSGSPNGRGPFRNEALQALVIFFRPRRMSRTHCSLRRF
jgi:hypothetical protein